MTDKCYEQFWAGNVYQTFLPTSASCEAVRATRHPNNQSLDCRLRRGDDPSLRWRA